MTLCARFCIITSIWFFASIITTIIIFQIPVETLPVITPTCNCYDSTSEPFNCEDFNLSICKDCNTCLVKNTTSEFRFDMCVPFCTKKITNGDLYLLGAFTSVMGLYILIL